ncbi:MAG: CDP-alcohol phosphatidyltransferase family protein [Coriobacteriia bacterium]|nr:CDP-alcohol phosphatidyltransferase family protein [Coriobacteriia bacterium]
MEQHKHSIVPPEGEVSNEILTIPNVISTIRLLMVPAFFVALMFGQDLLATALFAIAAFTDFLDGYIARRTNKVTKLGQLLDPAVDRCLMIFGVVGLMIIGRLPVWIVVLVLLRDLYLLVGGYYLLRRWKRRVAVIYPGKVATTLLFIGFCGLVLNMPLIPGLGWCDFAWLPGFNTALCSWSIWFVYAGLALTVFTTAYYTREAYRQWTEARAQEKKEAGLSRHAH